MEKTFVIIKPDALEKKLIDEIHGQITEEGLLVIEQKKVVVDLDFVLGWYNFSILYNIEALEYYLCNRPLIVWLVSGENAIAKMLCIKSKIRKGYNADQLHTLIHCPDSQKEFERTWPLFANKEKAI